MQAAAESADAKAIVVDLGPNLGAINRAALIAADHVVIPLGPDLFSLQGLRNLGPTLRGWRDGWTARLAKNPADDLRLPEGRMNPIGYLVMQHSTRLDRPVQAYEKWIARMPSVYREAVLGETPGDVPPAVSDPNCFTLLKHYRSLMPMAQEARKPIFFLKAADGALGAHIHAVQDAYRDFESLTRQVARKTGIAV